VAELAQHAGRGLARIDLQPDLGRRDVGGELRDLDRDQLRLALLVVDTSFENEYAVRLAQLPGSRVDGVEDDRLGAAAEVVETEEDHGLALLRRQLLHGRDDAADGDDLAVAAALEIGERPIALPLELARDVCERVLGDP
jgi:hypothetical protein